jgi:hypothetical protein
VQYGLQLLKQPTLCMAWWLEKISSFIQIATVAGIFFVSFKNCPFGWTIGIEDWSAIPGCREYLVAATRGPVLQNFGK